MTDRQNDGWRDWWRDEWREGGMDGHNYQKNYDCAPIRFKFTFMNRKGNGVKF